MLFTKRKFIHFTLISKKNNSNAGANRQWSRQFVIPVRMFRLSPMPDGRVCLWRFGLNDALAVPVLFRFLSLCLQWLFGFCLLAIPDILHIFALGLVVYTYATQK